MASEIRLGTNENPLTIVTNLENYVRVPLNLNNGFLNIWSNSSFVSSDFETIVDLYNNVPVDSAFAESRTPLLECKDKNILLYKDAINIWEEVKKELKDMHGLELDSGSPKGVHYNPAVKLADELELLLECIRKSNKEYIEEEMRKHFTGGNSILNERFLRYTPLFNYDINSVLRSDKNIYSSSGDFSPPSEKDSLRLELTEGCSWKKCTFCKGYEGKKYRKKSAEEFKNHLRNISFNLDDIYRKFVVRRIFIGEGNALSSDTETWLNALDLIKNEFPSVKKISTYARTNDILEKDFNDLGKLKNDGLNMLYWGIETGDNDILKLINKGYTSEMIVKAGEIANSAGIDLSVMIMPGLGGQQNLEKHEKETARILNRIKPKYVTLLGVDECNGAPYPDNLASSGINFYGALSESEKAAHIYGLLDALEPWGGKIGCFSEKVTPLARNPINFNNKVFDIAGKKELLNYIKLQIRLSNPAGQYNETSRSVASLS